MHRDTIPSYNRMEITITSLLLMFLAAVLGVAGHIVMFAISLCTAALLLFLPDILQVMAYMRYRLGKKSMSAKRERQSLSGMLHGYLIRYDFFADMSRNMRQTTLSGAISSGSLASPQDTSKNVIVVFVISVLVASVVSVAGFVMFANILFLSSFALPLSVRLYPFISNSLKSSDMSSFYDSELGYFLAYLQISTLSGFGLYDSMSRLLGEGIFESVEHDATTLKKWISLDGYAESVAINRLAEGHSHDTFRSFLFSYHDISKSNPEGLENFITHTADAELEKISGKDEQRITRVSSVFIYGAMAMIMAPVMMLTLMFMQSDSDTIQLVIYAIFLIPVAFTMFVFLSNYSQSDVTLNFQKRSVLGVVGILWYVVSTDILASVTLCACIVCTYNGWHVQGKISQWRSKADGFPKFIRDLIERYKVDSNFVISIKKLLKNQNNEKKYGMFHQILDDIHAKLYAVTDVPQNLFYDQDMPSKRIRLLMFILQTVFDGGHYSSVSALERIHSFSVKLNSIKNRMDDSVRISSVILYAAPLVFFLAMVGLSAILESFTSRIPEVSAGTYLDSEAAWFFERPDYSKLLLALKPAVLIMSICAGLVISKVAYSSLVATLPVGVCLGMAFVILSGWDHIFDVINAMIGPSV